MAVWLESTLRTRIHAAALAHLVILLRARQLSNPLFLVVFDGTLRFRVLPGFGLYHFVSFPCYHLIEARTRVVSALCA